MVMQNDREFGYIESRDYAYVRVSTKDQNLARQLDAMKPLNIPEHQIIIEQESGKNFADRAKYQAMKEVMLRPGDTLYVKELDRLGRNAEEIKEEWRYFIQNGINIVILDMPILDTRGLKNGMEKLIANIVLELLSYMAESERTKTRTRQREGIDSALARGFKFGAPKKAFDGFEHLYFKVKAGEMTAAEAMRQLGMKKNTYYRRVKELEANV